jgi:NADPH-dependent glutamate synthase beta subunit-like oxidoreductase/NAD(P)H-flavin reductase
MSQFNFHDLDFVALFQAETLTQLDQQFFQYLYQHNPTLPDELRAYRAKSKTFTSVQLSELLLACAPLLEEFLAEFFKIHEALKTSHQQTRQLAPIFVFKKWFVLRRARRRLNKKESLESFAELDSWLIHQLLSQSNDEPSAIDKESAVAKLAESYLADKEVHAEAIEKLTRWCIQALATTDGQAAVRDWVSFCLPQQVNHTQLAPTVSVLNDPIGRLEGPSHTRRQREGFKWTDVRMSNRQVQGELNYCIYCHDHEGDFCAKGFPQKKGEPQSGLKKDRFGNILTGCPLDEKISEMQTLKRDGYPIAALAMIMIDNPMCPLTGHRICNDCMKACIYQKQSPVNIPQIETKVLTDVLDLPWGVEIYDLLTRWNPLRQRQYLPKPYHGLKVLIAGMGPAGLTLAHHLLMEGLAVVGIDGLKIESLPDQLLKEPIYTYASIQEQLDERIMAGFGGVAEYGITVRWDKNFLKLVYLSLLRRPYFQVYGGVRFGGTLTVEDAWALGFDHLAIAVGAGLPQALPIPGSLSPGMRQAADFLMSLQLTGAAKPSSLANLQVRLPAVVIGGGLTGIDTATEVQAYYLVQIDKIHSRYAQLTKTFGETHVRESLDEASLNILDEFLRHAEELHTERNRAETVGTEPNIQSLLHKWGGVTVAYRRTLQESPAYQRNHEEIIKALEEGIFYVECLEPKIVQLDQYGHAQALVGQKKQRDADGNWQTIDNEVIIPAGSIFVATGAKPNVAYEFEHRDHFQRDGLFQYQPYHEQAGQLQPVSGVQHCKIPNFGPFTSYEQNSHRVTFIGDTHPAFHGSVVKAVASGMRTYPHIVHTLKDQILATSPLEKGALENTTATSSLSSEEITQAYLDFRSKIQDLLQPRLKQIQRHTKSVVELTIRAPLAAQKFQPGQFFRLQNFEQSAPMIGGTRLQTEALAMRCAGVDKQKGLISLMILEEGASSRLCATFRPGETISLMGPTGVRTRIPEGNETVMVIGGRMGAADIRAVGPALRAAGNRVLYIAGFQTADEVYCRDDLEAAADVIVWITARGEPVPTRRSQDCAASGDFVDILTRYAKGQISGAEPAIPLQTVNRVLIIGTHRLVRMIFEAREGILREYFSHAPEFTASVHGPMQCMLKGICAQCLQWQIDPHTKQRTKAVFACSWQDQPLDMIDIDNLTDRLSQNRLQEHLSNLWLDYLFDNYSIERVGK